MKIQTKMPSALSHLRVLDLSRVLAGPWSSQILADMGAEVIKIERPGSGDDTRDWGPPFLKDKHGNETHEAAYFLSANRGKKSFALDISKPEGQEIIRKLAAMSDILIENFKVDGLKHYGLDYASLKQINPKLIYCSITGFGQTGPYAHYAGYDIMIQAMGGMMSVTGERDDKPGGGPMKVGVAVTDIMTGMYATVAILGALEHRHQSGEGQYIDLALLDTQVAMLANLSSNYLVSGKVPQRMGNAHATIVPYQPFECADGHMILAVGNDSQFGKFCDIARAPEIKNDVRFATNSERVKHREVLVPLIETIIKQRKRDDWLAALEPAGVPCGPINNMQQVFDNPQVKHRNVRVDVPHPVSGTAPMVANPIKFSATPIEYKHSPPTLGQHTDEILHTLLNMRDDEIQILQKNKII
jgi:crotonobetainyl-CoA:carnitine CoA-transferase CaiB-like acyl-CoA transferase